MSFRKILPIVLIVLVLVCITPVFAEQTFSVRLLANKETVHPGDTISYTVKDVLRGMDSGCEVDLSWIEVNIDPNIDITYSPALESGICRQFGNTISCNDMYAYQGAWISPIEGKVKPGTPPGTLLKSSVGMGIFGEFPPWNPACVPIGGDDTHTTLVTPQDGPPGPVPVPEFPSTFLPAIGCLGFLLTVMYIRRRE
jgi:hypothetical protein